MHYDALRCTKFHWDSVWRSDHQRVGYPSKAKKQGVVITNFSSIVLDDHWYKSIFKPMMIVWWQVLYSDDLGKSGYLVGCYWSLTDRQRKKVLLKLLWSRGGAFVRQFVLQTSSIQLWQSYQISWEYQDVCLLLQNSQASLIGILPWVASLINLETINLLVCLF